MENLFVYIKGWEQKSIDHWFNFTGKITFLIYFMPCTMHIHHSIKNQTIMRNKYNFLNLIKS